MFEKEIEFIYNYNLNKLQQLGSFITYEQLLSTDIHPALLQYVSAEIDFLIYEDRIKLLKDSLFDYSGDVIVEHFANIGEEIKRTKKFSLDYLKKLLLHASSFNVNYLIRPKWSLLQFVFETESEKPKQIVEVKQILNYLYYYPYLKRLLISFFDKKRIIAISLSEMEELLNKIDKINHESNFDKVLDNALEGISEFINMGEKRNRKISLQMVDLFLTDKGLAQYKPSLTEKYGVNASIKFEISDFKNTILSYDSTSIEERDEIINQKLEEYKNEALSNYDEGNIVVDDNDILDNEDESELETLEQKEEISETEKKSFLESHIDNLANNSEDNGENNSAENDETDILLDEIELPDIDEAPRVDEENIEEVYELVTEEEELNEVVSEDEGDLERIELEDENDESDIILEENEELENSEEEKSNLIEQGTSVTFSSEELTKNIETSSEDETILDEAVEDWPTESSVESEEKESSTSEDSESSDIFEETENEEEQSIESDYVQEDSENDESASTKEIEDDELLSDEEIVSSEEEEPQQVLFKDEDFVEEEKETEEEILDESSSEVSDTPIVDIAVLLENKKIAKIIEVVFDYDMEEFANTIDKISQSSSKVEALNIIDETVKNTFIDTSIKEVKVFKNIISDFFK